MFLLKILLFQESIWCKFRRFEFFCTLFKYFWNQVAYLAPWELNLYTYMLIFDHNMRKEWRYEVKYLLEKSFFVVSPVSLLPRALPLRGRPGHVASGFWNLGEPFRPPAREGLGPYFLARSRSPLRPSPAHRHAWERRVITSNILFSQCCLPVSSLSCLFTHINMGWLYKISLFYQSLEGQSKAADSCKN